MRWNRRTVLTAVAAAPLTGCASLGLGEPRNTAPALLEDRLLSDWPWLARYGADDDAAAALPAAARRVVFMGDSITELWAGTRPDFFSGNGFVGRGISGQTTPQMLVRFWQDAISLQPRAVHIMGGTNDIANNTGPYDEAATKNNIRAMAALALAEGLRPILASVPPSDRFQWNPDVKPAAEIEALNAWIKAHAAREGFVYADYTTVLDDGHGAMRPGLSFDGVHPTAAGFAAMETVALAAVDAAAAGA